MHLSRTTGDFAGTVGHHFCEMYDSVHVRRIPVHNFVEILVFAGLLEQFLHLGIEFQTVVDPKSTKLFFDLSGHELRRFNRQKVPRIVPLEVSGRTDS